MPEAYTWLFIGSACCSSVNSRLRTRFSSPPLIHIASPQSERLYSPVRNDDVALAATPLDETVLTIHV